MFDATPASGPLVSSSIDVRTLARATSEELDALSFGVIGLDPSGTIVTYNLYESRLARLDRQAVLGRNFYADVAPCTRGAFEERVKRCLAGPPDASDRFDFVFDFKFGAQEVAIEVLRSEDGQTAFLLINRRRVMPPRPRVDPKILARAQVDLAPGEADSGVLRDELERRFVRVPAPLFGALRATLERLAPETWQLFAEEWGLSWGRRTAVDLESTALERRDKSLRELSMREVADLVAETFATQGWGGLTLDFSAALDGLLFVDFTRSALAEAAPPRKASAPGAEGASCHLVSGWLSGVLGHVAGKKLAAREIACVSSGAPRCTFAITGHDRREQLSAVVTAGASDPTSVRAAMRPQRRGS